MATRIMAAFYYVGRSDDSPEVNFDSWTLDTYGNRHYYAKSGYQVINEHVNVQADHASQVSSEKWPSTFLTPNFAIDPQPSRSWNRPTQERGKCSASYRC